MARLFKSRGYGSQAKAKVIKGDQRPDHNARFEDINDTVIEGNVPTVLPMC